MNPRSAPSPAALPLQHLANISRIYPKAWSMIDSFLNDRGKNLPDWPAWCFMPMSAWYAIISAHTMAPRLMPQDLMNLPVLSALGAWRYTQGVYAIDEELELALINTHPSGNIPTSILLQLPEWCLYINTKQTRFAGRTIDGFFVHLEYDTNENRAELRFLVVKGEEHIPLILHLSDSTIEESVGRAIETASMNADAYGIEHADSSVYTKMLTEYVSGLVSLVLYVCSHAVDWPDDLRPTRPAPTRTRRKGTRLLPARAPRIWKLGESIGTRLRSHREQQASGSYKLKPHIRRAHWHGFWKGPMDGDREFFLKWLPPTPVGLNDEDERQD